MKKRLYLPFRKQETNLFSGSNQIQLLASRSIFGKKINNSQIYSDAHQDIFKTTLNFTKESEQIKKGLGLGFSHLREGGLGFRLRREGDLQASDRPPCSNRPAPFRPRGQGDEERCSRVATPPSRRPTAWLWRFVGERDL